MRQKKAHEKMVHVVIEGNLFGYDGFVPESKVQKFLEWCFKCYDKQIDFIEGYKRTAKEEEKWVYDDMLLAATLSYTIKSNDIMTSLFEVAAHTLPNGYKLQVEQKIQFFWDDQYRLGIIEKIAPNYGECGWVKIKDYDWISAQVQIERNVWKPGEVVKGNAKPVTDAPQEDIEGF